MVAAHVELRHFGALPDGTPVPAVELTNGAGMRARVIALGAALQSLHVPDKDGHTTDVVLGHATVGDYLANRQYFGAAVGRFANRIARGKFSLDGRVYELDTNEGPNHLHGGVHGYDRALWRIDSMSGGEAARVTLSHIDADGTGGYPGEVRATATYALDDRNQLTIDYRATTDKTTIVNLTHHSYFNLSGEAERHDIMHHRLTLYADAYTPIDSTSIPTGEQRSVVDTPFDFREPRSIGARIRDGRDEQLRLGRGYDHNFVVRGSPGTLRPAARLEDPVTGRVLELHATAPGVQFYSGNMLDGTTVGKTGRLYRQGDGLCLEPQLYPDSPNHRDFPSALLRPGGEFISSMRFRFSTAR